MLKWCLLELKSYNHHSDHPGHISDSIFAWIANKWTLKVVVILTKKFSTRMYIYSMFVSLAILILLPAVNLEQPAVRLTRRNEHRHWKGSLFDQHWLLAWDVYTNSRLNLIRDPCDHKQVDAVSTMLREKGICQVFSTMYMNYANTIATRHLLTDRASVLCRYVV